MEQEQILIEPPLYFANDHVFDIDFHPQHDIMTACLVTGEVKLLSYNPDDVIEKLNMHYHTDSVRKVQFSPSGQYLASGSKDRTLGFVDQNGKLIHQIKQCHDSGINSIQFIDNQILASADEQGELKIWDLRSGQQVWQCHEQEESITQMGIDKDQTMLLSTSYDGTLGVYDLRKDPSSKERLYALSDCLEEDLLAIQLIKGGKFVLTSTSQGNIFVFKWDYFGDCQDIIRSGGTQSSSLDSMLKIDEDTILAAGEDGYLRALSIYPNQVINILGKHSEDDTPYPIFKIAKSRCNNYVASTSNDNSIKFYELSELQKERPPRQQEDFTPNQTLIEQRQLKKQEDRMEIQQEEQDEDEEDQDEDEEDGETSDSDEEVMVQKKVTVKNYEANNNTFFDGL